MNALRENKRDRLPGADEEEMTMHYRSIHLTQEIHEYVFNNGVRSHPLQNALHAKAALLPGGHMQIGPEHAQLLSFLVSTINAKRAIEVGVFAGYSALSLALALPEDGYLLACEVSDRHLGLAREFWVKAGVIHKIDLKLGPALITLEEEIAHGRVETYDLAFIDADKRLYSSYYESCMSLLRPGGVIVVDNVLWKGNVVGNQGDKRALEMDLFNRKLHSDERIDLVLLPFGDGITLARKR